MKKISKNKKISLDAEEKKILKSVESGNWKPLSKKEKEKTISEFKTAARNTFTKSKSISLRLSEDDLIKLKARALEEGLPYQTLLTSIIHKHVTQKTI